MSKKVFVSGCFDLLHSGHIAFFQAAAEYGDLYVAIGSDRTVFELKGRPTVNTEEERLFMILSVGCVTEAMISSGTGMLDFEPELRRLRPDIFVVNEDGDVPEKQKLCRELGIDYVVLDRIPHGDLRARSTTDSRRMDSPSPGEAARSQPQSIGTDAAVDERSCSRLPGYRIRKPHRKPLLT